MQVDFAGFKELVDSVGGVPVYFPDAGPRPQLGPRHRRGRAASSLDADQALGLRPVPRLRGLQRRRLAESTIRPATSAASAASRTSSAGVMRAGHRQGRPQPDQADAAGRRRHRAASRSTTSSRSSDMLDLGQRFRNFDPDDLQTYSLAGRPTAGPGGAERARLQRGARPQPILDSSGAPTTTTRRRRPAAGPARSGHGAQRLRRAGPGRARSPRRWPQVGFRHRRARRRRRLGPHDRRSATRRARRRAAQLVARYLAAGATLAAVDRGAGDHRDLGPDFTSVLLDAEAGVDEVPVPTTTTTAPPSHHDGADDHHDRHDRRDDRRRPVQPRHVRGARAAGRHDLQLTVGASSGVEPRRGLTTVAGLSRPRRPDGGSSEVIGRHPARTTT